MVFGYCDVDAVDKAEEIMAMVRTPRAACVHTRSGSQNAKLEQDHTTLVQMVRAYWRRSHPTPQQNGRLEQLLGMLKNG